MGKAHPDLVGDTGVPVFEVSRGTHELRLECAAFKRFPLLLKQSFSPFPKG